MPNSVPEKSFCVSFTILTLNVRGLADAKKRKLILEYYRSRAEIILLQETHSEKKDEKIWQSQWGGPIIFSHGTSNARGVAILFKKQAYFNITKQISDYEGRYVGCNVTTLNGLKFSLFNVYGPNQDRPAFFQALSQNISDFFPEKIIMGDFNLVLDVNLDRHNSHHNHKKLAQSSK